MRSWLPPVVAWLVAIVVMAAAAQTAGVDPLHASAWARSDSAHYESIALHGYDVRRCASHGWCGNTAWFPGYPLLLAAVHAPGIPLNVAGLLVAWSAALTMLLLVWRWWLMHGSGRYAGLACAAFAPGAVYLYAIFPVSILAVGAIVFLHALERNRFTAAGAAAAATALSYPVGLVAGVLVAGAWALRRRSWRALLIAVPPLIVGAALVVAQRVQTGLWDAYWKVERTYDGGLRFPLQTLWEWLRVLWHSKNPLGYTLAPSWQLLLVAILVLGAVAWALARKPAGARDYLLLSWTVAAWMIPLTQAHQAVWRSEAALVPLSPLVAHWPRPCRWVTACALAVVAFGLAEAFFTSTLSG